MLPPGSSRWCALAGAALLTLVLAGPAAADHPGQAGLGSLRSAAGSPANPVDVPAAPAVRRAEPPLVPTPQGPCGPGSRPEPGLQGRVSRAEHQRGRAAQGYTCNTQLIGSYEKANVIGSVGGFKVERYTDEAGHDCGYYDTTLLFPTNIFDVKGGVNVLDMSNPRKPVRTARLVTPAMLSPHESLVVNQKRGVLAAVLGGPVFNVGIVDLYDISQDCRHPVFKSSTPVGVFGHESAMAPDGKTFYSASPGSATIVGIDITNLSLPVPLWFGNYDSHGLSISNSGNRAYVAGINSGLIILDTSAVQARKPNPVVTEVARLQWEGMSIPQTAIPVTIKGKKYVVEIDEYGTLDEVGAGRIIKVEDETRPRVVSNLRLEVHQPETFGTIRNDPQAQLPLQGYAGHYCNVPRRKDPGIVACSMILSGLRVFDIRDPKHPKEIAYYNAPIKPRSTPGFEASNWAMSSPSFVPERGEIWYSDGFQGFYAIRVTNGLWPFRKCGGKEVKITAMGRTTRGTPRADVIVGRSKADVIRSGGGKDVVCSRGGDDKVVGGRGSDRLVSRAGNDVLIGRAGGDTLHGGRGNDRVRGGPGRDRLNGGPDKDRVRQ